jgi:hypothetical protein
MQLTEIKFGSYNFYVKIIFGEAPIPLTIVYPFLGKSLRRAKRRLPRKHIVVLYQRYARYYSAIANRSCKISSIYNNTRG